MEGPLGGFIRGLIGPMPGGPPSILPQRTIQRKKEKETGRERTKENDILIEIDRYFYRA